MQLSRNDAKPNVEKGDFIYISLDLGGVTTLANTSMRLRN